MARNRACITCRVRKVKCIPGLTRRCKRCEKLEFQDCIYKTCKRRVTGEVIGVGEACKRCRTKKTKCDAKRPCSKCANASNPSQCEYKIDDSLPLQRFHPSQFLFWDEPNPPGSSNVSSREHLAFGDEVPRFSAKMQVSTLTKPAFEVNHPLSRLPRVPFEYLPQALDGDRIHRLPPTFKPLLSPSLSRVSPRVLSDSHPILSLGARESQISDAAWGALDMKFRLRSLCWLNKLGIRFNSEKQHALLSGDTSGTVIHPFFIHASQSLGMYLCEGIDNSPVMIRLQAKHLQATFEWLAKIFKGNDWELSAQVALWVTAGSVAVSSSDFTFPYMQKGCEAISTGGLKFVPLYGRPPELSETLHEKLSVLSQTIYFENFLFLTCGGAEPMMTAGIEKEFPYQLPEVYPVLFNICPLIMRTKTILLVRDVVITLAHRPANVDVWRLSCDQLVAVLHDYSRTFLRNLRRFEDLGDKSGAGTIRSCAVICYAHLVALCEVLDEIGSTLPTEPKVVCDWGLERLSELSQDMCIEECSRLDLLLGVSWKRALEVFDARLAKIPPENSAKMRHWKQVVEKLHLELAAKLPNVKTPTLARRAAEEDGRVEGSQYPNLILPWERQQYGI